MCQKNKTNNLPFSSDELPPPAGGGGGGGIAPPMGDVGESNSGGGGGRSASELLGGIWYKSSRSGGGGGSCEVSSKKLGNSGPKGASKDFKIKLQYSKNIVIIIFEMPKEWYKLHLDFQDNWKKNT